MRIAQAQHDEERERREQEEAGGRQRLLDGLPRIGYSAALFSGSPYPDCCPICMEEWQDVNTGIVLTPCFHVFHETCLGGWFKQHTHCPTCRWDVTDAGEQKALDTSMALAASSTSGPTGGGPVVLSDSED